MNCECDSSVPESLDLMSRHLACKPRGSRYGCLMLTLLCAWHHAYDAQAHAEPSRLEVGAKLAPSLEQHVGARETPGTANTYKTGISVGAGARYSLLDWFSTQAELLYATRGSDVDMGGDTIGTFYFTYLELPVLARVRYPFSGDAVRPRLSIYALGGPSVSLLIGAEREDGAGRSDLEKSALHTFDLGLIGGLGVAWEITPDWVVSFEARYDRGFTDAFPDTRESKNEAFLLTLGVDFTLHHGDRDGDLVADYRDRCSTREDRNGYEDEDGCPDADSDDDNDEIADIKDQCRDKAEDKNGYKDDDGCPDADIDTDKDGVFDVADKCIDKAFGFNKDIELVTVPAELKDEVPGCPPPDHMRATVERDTSRDRDRDRLALDLTFDLGEEALAPRHHEVLNDVALLLNWYYPQIRLKVVGHTDSKSGRQDSIRERENRRESLKRADNVRDYLVRQGVDATRLEADGRGDKEPIDQKFLDNPRNRRVELIIIEKGPSAGEDAKEKEDATR